MSVPSIRVLHAVLNLHEGGLERVIGDLVRGFDRSRFDLHVLALNFLGRLSAGLDEYAELHVASPMSSWSMLRPASLAAEIGRIRPDVVHTHSGVWYKASLAARMAGVPFLVHTDHGRQAPDPWANRFVDGLAARRTDVVVAVSDVLGRQLARTVVADPSRIRVIPNGIDTERFKPKGGSEIRQELGIPPGAFVIGSIGRLDPIKRFDLMIEAFRRFLSLSRSGERPHLIIAGDGPTRPELTALVGGLRLQDSIHLLGWREDVHDLHAAFDLFTLSSASEGTSIGLLEAMSAELCPVATAVGGNTDVLGDGLKHRLVPAESAEALAAAWFEALGDRVRLRDDARTARRRVVQAFSLGGMVDSYAGVYRESLRGGPRRS